jgi:hypothetical protein
VATVSVVAVTLVLGALIVLLLRTAKLGLGSAVVCMLFGLVVASTPAGPRVAEALDSSGAWLWGQVSSL